MITVQEDCQVYVDGILWVEWATGRQLDIGRWFCAYSSGMPSGHISTDFELWFSDVRAITLLTEVVQLLGNREYPNGDG